MKKLFNLLAVFTFVLGCTTRKGDESVKYEANWESLSKHEAAPQWFRDAKLGIYFHWGPYSVPAYSSEWYPRNMHLPSSIVYSHHRETYGDPSEFGYHDFIPLFTGEHFDPEEWAELFQQAGARFGGPVAQHHDGFAMWDSEVNPWNAMDKGPKRDILGELFQSLEKRGMHTIATFHHARNLQRNADNPDNWGGSNSHFPYNPDWPTSSTDPELSKLYGNIPVDEFHQYWLDQVNEVVDKYAPDIIWFDSWLNLIPEKIRQQMVADYFNAAEAKDQDVAVAYKYVDLPLDVGILDFEQGGRKELNVAPWLTDVTLSTRSWSYIEGQEYKPADLVVRNMIDVWSKNGTVLLNISPMADGTIPDAQRSVLKEIGQWMKSNGEAVYGNRPHGIYGEGAAAAGDSHLEGQSAVVEYSAADVRYLVSQDKKTLYMFFLGRPEPGSVVRLRTLCEHRYPTASPIRRITVLESGEEASWELGSGDFYLTIPEAEMNEIATVFKLELE